LVELLIYKLVYIVVQILNEGENVRVVDRSYCLVLFDL
jgi:hypothetical protein